ncbi:MAG TPA: hypothetical protein PLD25_19575 [Chloroflexota bacterium]|nr:hypothetical protein [Chloroflexota bacterium]
MLNATRKKAAWVFLTVLALLMLAGTPLVIPAVFAGDCPNPTTGSC